MEQKKAQSLSLNTIIIAALGLVVLIVVALIFRETILENIKEYRNVAKEAKAKAGQNLCEIRTDKERLCAASAPTTGTWNEVNGKWDDCGAGQKCYEKQP